MSWSSTCQPSSNCCAYLVYQVIDSFDCRTASKQSRSTTYTLAKWDVSQALSHGTSMIGISETHRITCVYILLWKWVSRTLCGKCEYHFSYSNVLLFWNYTFHTGLCSTRRTYIDTFLPRRESQSGNLDHNIEAGSRRFRSLCCCTDAPEFPELLSWEHKNRKTVRKWSGLCTCIEKKYGYNACEKVKTKN